MKKTIKKKVIVVSLIQELPLVDVDRLKEQIADTFPGFEVRVIVGALNVTPIEVEYDIDDVTGQYL